MLVQLVEQLVMLLIQNLQDLMARSDWFKYIMLVILIVYYQFYMHYHLLMYDWILELRRIEHFVTIEIVLPLSENKSHI